MTDYFALLGLPRRPGLDGGLLQETYLRLAAAWHPDARSGEVDKFRDLQEARKTLLDPALRLRHLLALEGFESDIGGRFQPPADLFLEVAGVLDVAKKTTEKLHSVRSAIARAGVAAERAAAERKITATLAGVASRHDHCLAQIGLLDDAWPDKALSALDKISRELVFLSRWDQELKEKLFQLQSG